MDLIRLRRHLNSLSHGGYFASGWALLLGMLNAMDEFYLNMRDQEDHCQDGHESVYLDDESCEDLAVSNLKQLLKSFEGIPLFGWQRLLETTLDVVGFDKAQAHMNRLKATKEQQSEPDSGKI